MPGCLLILHISQSFGIKGTIGLLYWTLEFYKTLHTLKTILQKMIMWKKNRFCFENAASTFIILNNIDIVDFGKDLHGNIVFFWQN